MMRSEGKATADAEVVEAVAEAVSRLWPGVACTRRIVSRAMELI